MTKISPLFMIDFYKADHRRQYPKGTNLVYSNLTARGNKLSNLPNKNDAVVFFGLQSFIKEFLIEGFNNEFFSKPKDVVVAEYKRLMDNCLGKDSIPTDHIEALHDLGFLPLEIRALPEGTRVPMGVPLLTIHNTLPEFFWLTNYLESVMSAWLWKPIVSATTATWYKDLFDKYAKLTSSAEWFTQFQGHDFSFRGQSSPEDAARSGMGHILSFTGTDTIPSIVYAEKYYNANIEKELVGCSVPATEHSVMCMGTKEEEIDTFRRLITEVYPSGIVSIVSDTWDLWKVITEYLPQLKQEILSRTGGPVGDKVVIRPDSGNPVDIICGYNKVAHIMTLNDISVFAAVEADPDVDVVEVEGRYFEVDNYGTDEDFKEISPAEVKGAIELLWDIFGGTVNEKGYKELDPHIGLIYGDSITPERAEQILERLEAKGFASTNVVFGIGSYTYQYVTRDTYSIAMKATYGEVNGEARNIQKDPQTDTGTKKSHCGLLKVTKTDQDVLVVEDRQQNINDSGLLEVVFKDGKLEKDLTLADIRTRINLSK